MEQRVSSIAVDYEHGILIINGKYINSPCIITIKENDGIDSKKMINCDNTNLGLDIPEIVIDTRDFVRKLQKQEIKELIKQAIKENLPTKLPD